MHTPGGGEPPTPDGRTELRRRLLSAAGWKLAAMPYHAWSRCEDAPRDWARVTVETEDSTTTTKEPYDLVAEFPCWKTESLGTLMLCFGVGAILGAILGAVATTTTPGLTTRVPSGPSRRIRV